MYQISSRGRNSHAAEGGVALLIVVFTIMLASIVVVQLTYSTYIASRLHATFEQRFKAEYLLKSTLNVARVLISEAKSDADPPKDSWGAFTQGAAVPAAMLGVDEPNLTIALEINGEESKLPLRQLRDPTQGGARFEAWRDSFARLFELLEFDNDGEVDQTGLFPGRVFTSRELVANLIDYMDEDTTSYSDASFAEGIEAQLPKKHFPDRAIEKLEELNQIPGFTPSRIEKLQPHVTPVFTNTVNVNIATVKVLQAIDENLSEDQAREIVTYARGPDGPFNSSTMSSVLETIIGRPADNRLTYRSKFLQVLAKAQFGDTKYFLRAYVQRPAPGNDELPSIQSLELFG